MITSMSKFGNLDELAELKRERDAMDRDTVYSKHIVKSYKKKIINEEIKNIEIENKKNVFVRFLDKLMKIL